MKPIKSHPDTGNTWPAAAVMGLLALLLATSRINHGLVDSVLPAGPGLTTDESINVRQSVYLFDAFTLHGPMMMLPGDASRETYSHPAYLSDYVPLGRFLLGLTHGFTSWMISGAEISAYNIPAARLASCVAFAGTVMLMVLFTGRRYGTPTAVLAAALLMLMPRVVGHARIASLETLTTLAWFAALFPLLQWWTGERPPTIRQSWISGFLWGLLMLVKIQGVLLPPVITVYALVAFRLRGLLPLSVMAVTGLAVFYGGWPWLWQDPVNHLSQYLGSATDRLPINNWYLSHRFVDKLTPWHFPVVMLALTIPLHALLGLICRLWKRQLDSAERLLLTSIAIPVLVFSLPGTPVYDGARLFLFVMPAVAILAARGIMLVTPPPSRLRSMAVSRRSLLLLGGTALLIDAAFTVPQLGPYAGDAWNHSVRLLDPAATRLESSYWGTGINGTFWQQVPQGSTVAVAPVLHPVLLRDMMAMIPLVQQRKIHLEPFYYDPQKQRGLVLLIHRLADLPPQLRIAPDGNTPRWEVRSNGRVLARLVDTTHTTWQETPGW